MNHKFNRLSKRKMSIQMLIVGNQNLMPKLLSWEILRMTPHICVKMHSNNYSFFTHHQKYYLCILNLDNNFLNPEITIFFNIYTSTIKIRITDNFNYPEDLFIKYDVRLHLMRACEQRTYTTLRLCCGIKVL